MMSPRQPSSPPRPGLALWLAAAAALLALVPAVRADDAAWPRQFDSPSGTFAIYQPQPDTLIGDLLSSRAAFSLLKSGTQNPVYGVIWFTEQMQVDRDFSTVDARNLDVTRVRLPGITAAESQQYERLVEDEAAHWDLSCSMEELRAGLAASEKERASVADLDMAPPHILFSYQRAILVPYDGDPALEAIENTDLERVANTPFAVIYDPASGDYYLDGGHIWYASRDPLADWQEIAAPPAAVVNAVPPDTSSTDESQGEPPIVLTATEPSELISIDGPAELAPLVDGELLYITNTEGDVVREVSTQAIYVLLAGRWYRAPSFDGPWTFVRGDQLPESFSRVPADSPKGEILASVAGTDQADDAVADAEIPQTAAIARDNTDFQVDYDDAPQFESIEGTDLEYATNTDAQVIFADGLYYACDQGVWYNSDSPDGPWRVSETRPLGIDDIPPSCPVYNLRYAYIYDFTPTVVYMGYLPGYLGCYPYYGTVVYGTGFHYRAWRSRRHYFPRPHTWGFYARYNPWLSRWSFGYSYGSAFLWVGYRWYPHHGGRGFYARPLWFGPGGYHRPLLGPDRRPMRTRLSLRQRPPDVLPVNLYSRSANIQRVDITATRTPAHQVRPLPTRTASLPNNVFAGKDGKVYQRDTNGKWEINQGKRWAPATEIAPKPPARAKVETTTPTREREATPPAVRSFPTRVPTPTPPKTQAHAAEPSKPAPPAISKKPGNLERDYQARKRTSEAKQAEPAAPEKKAEPSQPVKQPEKKPQAQPKERARGR